MFEQVTILLLLLYNIFFLWLFFRFNDLWRPEAYDLYLLCSISILLAEGITCGIVKTFELSSFTFFPPLLQSKDNVCCYQSSIVELFFFISSFVNGNDHIPLSSSNNHWTSTLAPFGWYIIPQPLQFLILLIFNYLFLSLKPILQDRYFITLLAVSRARISVYC